MQRSVLQVRDVEHFHWRLTETESPVVFSNDGASLSLAAAVELACIAKNWRSGPKDTTTVIRVTNCPLWSLVKAARWPGRSSPTSLRDGDVGLVVLPLRANELWWSQRMRDLLNEVKASGFPNRLAGALVCAVAEMADNVWQHSETNAPGLLAYQLRKRRFAFGVADSGIGVLASLRKNSRYRHLSSSMQAVRAAVKPGVSRFPDGNGLGFPSLLHALADLWGTARIRSGEAGLVIDRTQDQRETHLTYLPDLPGVHVSVRCALDAPSPTKNKSLDISP